MDLRLEAAALSEIAENTKDDPGFRVPKVDWERPAAMSSPWNGSTASRCRMSRVSGLPAMIQRACRHADPVLPAPHAARRLLPCRYASGNLFVDPTADRGRRHELPAVSEKRSAVSLPRSSTASSRGITCVLPRCISRPAMCRRTTMSQALPRRSGDRRADPRQASRNDLHGTAADPAFRGHRTLRHADASRARHAAEDDGRRRRRVAHPHPRINMWKAAEPVVSHWIRDNLGRSASRRICGTGRRRR